MPYCTSEEARVAEVTVAAARVNTVLPSRNALAADTFFVSLIFRLTIPNFLTRSFPLVASPNVSTRRPSMVTMISPTVTWDRKEHAGSMAVICAPAPFGRMERVRPRRPGETVSIRRAGKLLFDFAADNDDGG